MARTRACAFLVFIGEVDWEVLLEKTSPHGGQRARQASTPSARCGAVATTHAQNHGGASVYETINPRAFEWPTPPAEPADSPTRASPTTYLLAAPQICSVSRPASNCPRWAYATEFAGANAALPLPLSLPTGAKCIAGGANDWYRCRSCCANVAGIRRRSAPQSGAVYV